MKRALSSSFIFTTRGRMHLSSSSVVTKPQRPAEIPFQPKLANSLNFIGIVQSPIQFLASVDGSYWASTTLSQNQPFPISIPIVFQGDLAHTAASHLKPDDNVYISGHLSSDKLPLSLPSDQYYFQVMVQSLSFVQGSPYATYKSHLTSDEKVLKPESAITRKGEGVDPEWWDDLVNNFTEWKDHRYDKMNKVVKERHPDFTHKANRRALWLTNAPSYIIEILKRLEPQEVVGTAKNSLPRREELTGSEPQEKVPMAKKPLPRRVSSAVEGEGSWKDLMENPSRWWDNRGNKPTERHPDFKNKDTGEALWLNSAPQWATEKLPHVKA